MENKAIFLGGTCNGSHWRKKLIPHIDLTYFNPVVDEWNDAAQLEEIKQRENCKKCLYVLTPKMEGFYSVAELVDDSNKRPDKTVYFIMEEEEGQSFSEHQLKSLKAIGKLVEKNGGRWSKTFEELITWLNK